MLKKIKKLLTLRLPPDFAFLPDKNRVTKIKEEEDKLTKTKKEEKK